MSISKVLYVSLVLNYYMWRTKSINVKLWFKSIRSFRRLISY